MNKVANLNNVVLYQNETGSKIIENYHLVN